MFGVDDEITREQLAVILKRYAEYKELNTYRKTDISDFSDSYLVSPWASDAMQWASAEGLINGRTERTLVPKGTATRAEVACILMRFSKNYEIDV